jgi:hypothetical protein
MAAGQSPEPSPSPSPAPSAAPGSTPAARVKVGGFVDAYYGWNVNRPADHANFFPGAGTTAKRDNEVSVNLAQIDLTVDPAPVGFRLAVGLGTSTEVVHAFEPVGVVVGPEVWKNVIQASVQWKTGVGRGLLLEAGIYPSHIGLETLASKDNWNYTRGWLGEFSPYYQTGLKLAYPFSDRWSAQLHVLNGWQTIGDNNRGKSIGTQIAYSGPRLSVSLNGIAGPELADDNHDVRVMGDIVATYQATSVVSLAVSLDAAREGRPAGPSVSWKGVGAYVRLAPSSSRSAFALRGELYDDPDGAISGSVQTLKGVTATFEHRPTPNLILKLEGRYDRSSADVFARQTSDPDGNPLRKRDQLLVLVGAVATF